MQSYKNSLKNEITMEVGGWVQFLLGKTNNNWKIFPNCPILVLISWGSIPCIFVCIMLLKPRLLVMSVR